MRIQYSRYIYLNPNKTPAVYYTYTLFEWTKLSIVMNLIYVAKLKRQNEHLPKMKNCAQYEIICIYYLIWGIALEIKNEITKKIKRREILSRIQEQ